MTTPFRRRTLDGVLHTSRAQAVQQLVRVEHEAAYAGRVAGRIQAAPAGTTGGHDERCDARAHARHAGCIQSWSVATIERDSAAASADQLRAPAGNASFPVCTRLTSTLQRGAVAAQSRDCTIPHTVFHLSLCSPYCAGCRDARFIKTLVAGVTRWRRRLDFILDELTAHRVTQV